MPTTHDRKRCRDEDSAMSTRGKAVKLTGLALTIPTELSHGSPNLDDLLSAPSSATDSLFDEPLPQNAPYSPALTPEISQYSGGGLALMDEPLPPSVSVQAPLTLVPAQRTAPAIPGLYFDPSILLPDELCEDIMWKCIRAFFQDGTANQVMLFERPPSPDSAAPPSGLPPYLIDLVQRLSALLQPHLPPEVHQVLFEPAGRARQAIINLYWPGEGITPHVDLLDRYGDGILGVSFGSGCVMDFAKVEDSDASNRSVYLPCGSVIALTGEARYGWTHGIDKRFEDVVEGTAGSGEFARLERDVRLSVTLRWLLPGADVVGPRRR